MAEIWEENAVKICGKMKSLHKKITKRGLKPSKSEPKELIIDGITKYFIFILFEKNGIYQYKIRQGTISKFFGKTGIGFRFKHNMYLTNFNEKVFLNTFKINEIIYLHNFNDYVGIFSSKQLAEETFAKSTFIKSIIVSEQKKLEQQKKTVFATIKRIGTLSKMIKDFKDKP